MPDRTRFPTAHPKDSSWSTRPISDWQGRMREELLRLLIDARWLSRFATLLYFKDYMVQVYLDNWTLHFQVGIGGWLEFDNADYGDLEGKALIAFDVEGARPGIRRADLNRLQGEIRAALKMNGVYETLGVSPDDCRDHHLVMETAAADDIEYAARRIVEYMDAIYDIVQPILERLEGAG